jgi:hypothetical protein
LTIVHLVARRILCVLHDKMAVPGGTSYNELNDAQCLVGIRRGHGARSKIYLVKSRFEDFLLMSQNLSLICEFINESVASAACEHVGKSSLYEAAHKADSLCKLRRTVERFEAPCAAVAVSSVHGLPSRGKS